MEEKQIRAVCYCRVSTEEQAEHGYSIDAQQAAIEQYCTVYGKKIVGRYVDAGISGKEMTKRLELQRMLKDAKENQFDEVIVWKLNRLSRNTKDLLEIVGELSKNNIGFTSISEKFDTSQPTGKFVMQMLASVGELERNTIVDNVKLALKQRARLGYHSGGLALGYTLVPSKSRAHKKELAIVPEEAALVRRIYTMFKEGHGIHYIVNTLNAEGLTTKRGKQFSYFGIKTILDNPLYKGWVQYGIYENWNEKRRKGKTKPILAKGIHEPIISEELWDKVQAIRKRTSHDTPNIYGNILVGLLVCPECGGKMVISYSHYNTKQGVRHLFRRYHCYNHKKHTGLCENGCHLKADDVEADVIRRLKKVLTSPRILKGICDKVRFPNGKKKSDRKAELSTVQKQLDDIDVRRGRLVDLYSFGDMDKALLDSRLQELVKQRETLEVTKTRLLSVEDNDTAMVISEEYILGLLSHFEEVLTVATPDQKRLLLRLMVDHITVREKKIDKIYLRIGKELEEYLNGDNPPTFTGRGVVLCLDDIRA